MENRGKKLAVILTTVLVILGGLSVVIIMNIDRVQELYGDMIGKENIGEDTDNGESEDSNTPDFPLMPPENKKPPSEALNRILSSSSVRAIGSITTVVPSDSEFFPLIGTPIAIYYSDKDKNGCPLLIAGDAANYFLEIYNTTEIMTIGNVEGMTCDFSFPGDEKTASLEAAKRIWSKSDGALIIEKSAEGYEIGVAATVLSSYLNIPVIVTNELDKSVIETLDDLDVSYTLICGNLNGYSESYHFTQLEDVYNLALEFLLARFGKVSYLTITNSEDVYSTHGITQLSSLASYLSSSYFGIVLNCPVSRLSSGIFQENSDTIVNLANEMAICIKMKINELLVEINEFEMLSYYVTSNPYLAILGDPYSIPFYYIEDPSSGYDPTEDELYLATDDYYADLDNDSLEVELAIGRILALSPGGVSAMIARSLFYDTYMDNWEADSRVTEVKGADWKETAYVGKGDDWNGAAWVSTGDYWYEVYYLQDQGYTVQTTQRRATGATVSQEILKYYSSSSLIYVLAHGSPDSYQLMDSVDSSDVRNWDLGPSIQVLTSCSAARTDVSEIEETISLAFIEVGENAFIGGTRTESSGSSPTLSSYFIEGIVSSDETIGIAHRDAKNRYTNGSENRYDDSAIRVLYGDPAFNPYQP